MDDNVDIDYTNIISLWDIDTNTKISNLAKSSQDMLFMLICMCGLLTCQKHVIHAIHVDLYLWITKLLKNLRINRARLLMPTGQ